jgi:uncharacterized membrane protein
MIDTLLGLPAHPLLVHAAVVFGPLLVAAAIAYALVPPIRNRIAWAVLGLGAVAPITLWLAKLSGDSFLDRQVKVGAGPEFVRKVHEHAEFGERAAWYGTALGVLAILLVLVVSAVSRRPTDTRSQIVTYGLAVLSIVAAAITGYYVFKTGHSGATNVWGG